MRALKRKVYFIVLPFGLTAVLADWAFKGLNGIATPVDVAIFATISVWLTILLIALWRVPQFLLWIEGLLFIGVALSLLAKFYEILFSGTLYDHALELVDLLYWFPLVYVLAYIMFQTRIGLIVSLVFVGFLTVPSLARVAPDVLNGEFSKFNLLLRFILANVAYSALLFVVAWTRERYAQLRAYGDAMAFLANTDSLMMIPNRRQIEILLEAEMDRAQRYGQMLSIIVFDIDHFKRVNDQYGHGVGDYVLKEVALIVKNNIRPSDEVGRWGGEEFLIVAPQTEIPQAESLTERLRLRIAQHPLEIVGHVTVSFGIANYGGSETSERLLQRADEALYRAKANGRNRVEVARE